MPYRKLTKKPAQTELAKNVPARGMHGYLSALSDDSEHWASRRQSMAGEPIRSATFIVVHEMVAKFAHLGVDMPSWQLFGAINKGLNRGAPGWEGWNKLRCEMLGLAPLSRLCKSEPGACRPVIGAPGFRSRGP